MNIVPTLYLAAILASPLHAQVCSGGSGGGTDATGNQCGDAATVEPYASSSDIASPRSLGKMGGILQSSAAAPGPGPTAKMSGAPNRSTELAQGVGRFAKAAVSPGAPVRTSKIETTDVSACAGGPNGGMDATGNECGEALADAGSTLVARGNRH